MLRPPQKCPIFVAARRQNRSVPSLNLYHKVAMTTLEVALGDSIIIWIECSQRYRFKIVIKFISNVITTRFKVRISTTSIRFLIWIYLKLLPIDLEFKIISIDILAIFFTNQINL